MKRLRPVRLVCLVAVAGLGVPLLAVTTSSVPAAGAQPHPLHLAHNQKTMKSLEKRMETRGYLNARARYANVRRLAGDKPISLVEAAQLRAKAATSRRKLSNSPAVTHGARPAVASPVSPAWTPLAQTKTAEVGRTTGNFELVSGRVSALAVGSAGRIFLGAAQGGVWRYNPTNKTWTPLTDNLSTLAVGAIAIAPSNQKVIYLGTGEGDLSGDSYYGNGVYRSADGGNTWQHVNGGSQFVGASISRIVVDPKRPNVLYAATIRGKAGKFRVLSPFQKQWGVYRSTDGGKHWTLLKGTTNHERGATDIALDPHVSSTVYATFWGTGIFKTTAKSHQTKWTKIMTGLPKADYAAAPTRFAISAVKLGKATRLYAGFEWIDTKGAHHDSRLFRSDNGGVKWMTLPVTGVLGQVDSVENYCDIQCDYDNVVTADPAHPDTVYVAGEYNYPLGSGGIYRSTDGGKTWKDLGLDLHPDFHAIALQPGKTSHVVIGNDGGVWDSATKGGRLKPADDLTKASWNNLNNGLDTTQMESIAYSDHPPFESTTGPVYYGGTQDNGTQIGPVSAFGNVWFDIGGGDGGEAFVDPNHSQFVYGEFYGISPYRFNDAGGITADGGINVFGQQSIAHGINQNDRSEFYVPWVQNQINSNQLFLGTYRLYRTDNGEAPNGNDVQWKPISGDLTTGCTGPAPNTGRGCLISAVGLAEGGTGVYVGTEEGLVQVSPNATTADHPTWTEKNSGLPGRPVSAFAVDRSNWRIAYAAYAGYSVTTPGAPGHVFKTTDGGDTWTNISGGAAKLPDNPVNDLVLDPSDPNTLFAGTDVGVFVTHDRGSSWHQLASGMPTVAVNSLKWNPARGQAVAATHGRGGWTLDTALQRPALVATTSDDGTPVGPGTKLSYAITVSNIGNADALNAQVTVPVPSHTTYFDSDHAGSLSAGKVHWTVADIAPGAKATLHFTVTIGSHLASSVASILSDGLTVAAVDSGNNPYGTSGSPHVTDLAPPHAVQVTPSTQTDGGHSGQSVDFPVTVTNEGFQADSFTISTDQHWVTSVLDSTCANPLTTTATLQPGASEQVCVRVDVPADAVDSELDTQQITATSTADNSVHDTAKVTAIAVTVDTLLVDEDGSAPGNGVPDGRGAYTAALNAAGVPFAVWDLASDPVLPPGYLNAHTHVYWFTGTSYPDPLGKYETELTSYLGAGHSLFVSGMDILDQGAGTASFVKDYLHVDWDGSEAQNDKGTVAIHGITGTAIGGGFGAVPLNLPAGYGPFEDQITPTPNTPAVAQFRDDSAKSDALAVTDTAPTSHQYRVVFLAFPFEAFGAASDRSGLVTSVESYFNGP